ncbi:SLAP domain-containing protein [Xylocopilactobacillus apicola]|uniref:Surface layer protein A domain-containing protein n=1 Tax=Xylocopilactobacillus apicola TaxID=2932184 RepID=A0AAU9D5G9_9LACO|nr:SLAP domain-containing protein [Xylocopilactobacillus apicola]BDR58738.1 hypothetical protein XA3_11790 [Xylocopilactobacillus apicola]
MKFKFTKIIGAAVVLLSPLAATGTVLADTNSAATYGGEAMTPLSGSLLIRHNNTGVFDNPYDAMPPKTTLPKGSNWKVFGYLNGCYNVGKNQWVRQDDVIYPSESTASNTIGYVNYVPFYGVRVTTYPSLMENTVILRHGTALNITQKSVIDGKTWYQFNKTNYLNYGWWTGSTNGSEMWIPSDYVSFNPIYTPLKENYLQVQYIKGYSIRVFQSPDGSKPTNQYLKDGTYWKVFGYQNDYYQVGNNQWVQAPYVALYDNNHN